MEDDMNWKTIYIVGRDEFYDDVVRNLERSEIKFMEGYHSHDAPAHKLFWIPEDTDLREFKLAIGAKTVFKYRLRFYFSLEGFMETFNSSQESLTEEEQGRVEKMRARSMQAA